MIERTIGPYHAGEKLGEGGMGVVYKAHDPRLARDVAIKVLPEAFTRQPDRMVRFEREAKLLASLNHPNIAILFGLEESDGVRALVMEYVEGPTLAERIRAGAIPADEAIVIARQIADALDAAHEKGITHRDLKPANVKITPEGKVKLLDFGLATAMEGRTGYVPDAESTPTLTMPLSGVGSILGTPAYMSPEQARGMRVDKRADIWAFGVVLWEMLTGNRLFQGNTVSDTLAAVLKTDPDWSKLPRSTPTWVRNLLRRCLERDVKKRLRDIGDAFVHEGEPEQVQPSRPWLSVAAGVVACALLVGTMVWLMRVPKPAELPVRTFSFAPESLSLASVEYLRNSVLSPDGRHIAYVGGNQLWIRDLDDEQPRLLTGTEGAAGPFWSPDSGYVAFATGGELKKIAAQGGVPISVGRFTGSYRGGAWSPDGKTMLVSLVTRGLDEVPAAGGPMRRVITTVASQNFYNPQFLPLKDGRRIVLAGVGTATRQNLELIDLETGKREVLRDGGYPSWSPSGHILFRASAAQPGVWALPFSTKTLQPVGEALPILDSARDFSDSSDGTLLWTNFHPRGQTRLVWRDRSGKLLATPGQPQEAMRALSISPDGKRVALSAYEQGNLDVWIHDLERAVKTRLTFDPANESSAQWSPSGKEIAFYSVRSGESLDIWLQAADGSSEAQPLAKTPLIEIPTSWSRDGSMLFFSRIDPKTGYDIWYIQRKPDGSWQEAVAFPQSEFNEMNGQISPDGRFVLYTSEQTGRIEIFVRSFPEGGYWQVSAQGGEQPRWSRDGREILYVENRDTLVSVPVSTTGVFSKGAVKTLFRNAGLVRITEANYMYDLSPDGKRILIAEPVEGDTVKPPAIHVIQNWPAMLLKRQMQETP